jgi:GAF domain-containing protein
MGLQRLLKNSVLLKGTGIMGITAPLVTDGILLPWQVDETRGTIFVMAHGRTEAFDQNDQRMMQMLADFAAMAVRHRKQQQKLMEQAAATAAADMANQLAHRINNPSRASPTSSTWPPKATTAKKPRS